MREYAVNEQIRAREVRVIDSDGKQIGVLPIEQAQGKAKEAGLDLILLVPDGKPPICRICDYGKFRYELGKKEKEARKSQRASGVLKEIKLTPKISEHDFQVRLAKIEECLKKGYRVKVTMAFRGREMAHPEFGVKFLERVLQSITGFGESAGSIRREGRFMILMLSPK